LDGQIAFDEIISDPDRVRDDYTDKLHQLARKASNNLV
jgi:hypothetical protein